MIKPTLLLFTQPVTSQMLLKLKFKYSWAVLLNDRPRIFPTMKVIPMFMYPFNSNKPIDTYKCHKTGSSNSGLLIMGYSEEISVHFYKNAPGSDKKTIWKFCLNNISNVSMYQQMLSHIIFYKNYCDVINRTETEWVRHGFFVLFMGSVCHRRYRIMCEQSWQELFKHALEYHFCIHFFNCL